MARLSTYVAFIACLVIVSNLIGMPSVGLKYIDKMTTPLGANSSNSTTTNSTSSFAWMPDVGTYVSTNAISLTLVGLAALGLYLLGYAAIYVIAGVLALALINLVLLPMDFFICPYINILAANTCLDPLIGIPLVIILNLWGILAIFSAIKSDI